MKKQTGSVGAQSPAAKSRLAHILLVAIPIVALVGCASVTVHKLNKDGRVDRDDPEGLRFYRPRPYVAVTEPFVIASSVYLATGEMSPDGSFVLLKEVPKEIESAIKVNRGPLDFTSKSHGRICLMS